MTIKIYGEEERKKNIPSKGFSQLHNEAVTSFKNFAFDVCVLISAGFMICIACLNTKYLLLSMEKLVFFM